MKIINLTIAAAGIFLLIVRSRAGYMNDEAIIYNYQFSYTELILYSWGPLILLITTTFLLLANIFNRILKEAKYVKNKNYTIWMFIASGFSNVFGLFILNSQNFTAILKSGWIGLFDFPFFWNNIFLLLFWISMPTLKKIIEANENSTSQKESTK